MTGIHYAIVSKADFHGPDGPLPDHAERVEFHRIRARVVELSGRDIAPAWFERGLRRNGRVYVATQRNSIGRQLYGRGFMVLKVTP